MYFTDQDGAEPCASSVSAGNLIRLAFLLDTPSFSTDAEELFKCFSERLQKIPLTLPEMVAALISHRTSVTQVSSKNMYLSNVIPISSL